MRLATSCSECRQEDVDAGQPIEGLGWYFVDLSEDDAYVSTCERGHVVRFTLQNMRYELLYEAGVVAMLTGFRREAVSSMATALERFLEFAIYVFLEDEEADPGEVTESWRDLSSKTERQLGAFLLLHLSTLGRPYFNPKNTRKDFGTYTELRNRIVHAGIIPTEKETMTVARYVFDRITSLQGALVEMNKEAVEKVEQRSSAQKHRALENKSPPVRDAEGRYNSGGTAVYSMMLSRVFIQGQGDSFEERLKAAEGMLDVWGL